MKRRKAKIRQVKKGSRSGQWTFRLIGDNGEPVASTHEWYKNSKDMIDMLMKYFPEFMIINETPK